MYSKAKKERRNKERERVEEERLTCPAILYYCYVTGVKEMVRNNRINKWVEIYIQKCARSCFFFLSEERGHTKKLSC